MPDLRDAIARQLLSWGADLVGFASIDRFADAPEGCRPTDYMPECRTVISLGMHLFEGMADVWGEYGQAGRTLTPYIFYGYGLPNMEGAGIASRMARLLEREGFKSLCFLPTWPTSLYKYMDETETTNKMRSEFSQRHAAVAAGLGELGWNGLVLTPEFGSMQRFNAILTSAEVEPSPLYAGPPLCRSEECRHLCVRVCPADAFSMETGQECRIGSKTVRYSTHDAIRCLYAVQGLVQGSGGRSDVKIPEGPGKMTEFATAVANGFVSPHDKAMKDVSPGVVCGNFCGKCLHKCPARKLNEKHLAGISLADRYSSLDGPRLLR